MRLWHTTKHENRTPGAGDLAHKVLVAIHHMPSQQVSHNDLGDLYLDQLNKNHLTRNLVHRLERLGYAVTLTLQQNAA